MNLIPMTPVSSSNIQAVGYDEDTGALRVEFTDGKVYLYTGVDEGTYKSLMSATSKGKYFRDNIRESFSYTRE